MIAFETLNDRLHEAIVAAGVAVTSVKIGTVGVKATYLVTPTDLQASAQPTIDAFVDSQAAEVTFQTVTQPRAQAVDRIDNNRSAEWKLLRAVCEVIKDEFNIIYGGLLRPITSITRSGTVATVITPVAHGLASNAQVFIHGADVAAYNGSKTITVTSATQFTYPGVAGNPVTPAAGSLCFAANASAVPLARTMAQVVTAVKNKITTGAVD